MDEKLIQQLEKSLYREVDDNRELFGCKKISPRLFKDILEPLIDKGWIHEQIIEDIRIFFDKAFMLYPNLKQTNTSFEQSPESASIDVTQSDVAKALKEVEQTKVARNVGAVIFGIIFILAMCTINNSVETNNTKPNVFFHLI